jgi:hypothetical protein
MKRLTAEEFLKIVKPRNVFQPMTLFEVKLDRWMMEPKIALLKDGDLETTYYFGPAASETDMQEYLKFLIVLDDYCDSHFTEKYLNFWVGFSQGSGNFEWDVL